MRSKWPDWLSTSSHKNQTTSDAEIGSDEHLNLAKNSLHDLLNNRFVPESIQQTLAADYREVESMLEKLEHGHIHIAVFGRVSVGKSALVNALLGEKRFNISPLHGETKFAQHAQWLQYEAEGIQLIDTPGINEIEGKDRERIANEVAERSDLVLFVVDADFTEIEYQALKMLTHENRPIILVLNKADRYSRKDKQILIDQLTLHAKDFLPPHQIVCASANPNERLIIQVDEEGNEEELWQQPEADVWELKNLLWEILEVEGKSLAALNATIFAGKLNEQISRQMIEIKSDLAERTIRFYCMAKGLAVAVNPIPVADLVAATALDVALVVHMGRIYGLKMSRTEAGSLIKTISAQMILLMGTIWGVHMVSSILKGGSFGLSAIITASIQGAVAFYGTLVIGKAVEQYFMKGGSWGEDGPKSVVQQILNSLDKNSVIEYARKDIQSRLKG